MHIGIAIGGRTIKEVGEWLWVEGLMEMISSLNDSSSLLMITDSEFVSALPQRSRTLRVPVVSGYFGLRRWYNKTLPALVKKEAIDALIIVNGCPANLAIPQLPVLLSPTATIAVCNTWLRFLYKRFLTKKLGKSRSIGLISKLQIPQMRQQLGINESQPSVLGYIVPAACRPVSGWQQREQFLQKQTGGREYFLCTGGFSEERFLHLLKAFSLFKKRQQSNMQLLVPVDAGPGKALRDRLDTYKYRQDVQLLSHPNETLLPQLIAGAYAVVFIETNGPVAYPVAAAVQCNVPVIALQSNEAASEIAGAAALYADTTVESLAEKMKQIYKDEALRQQLIFNAQQQAERIDGREAARKILALLTI